MAFVNNHRQNKATLFMETTMSRILLVDDDTELTELLSDYLSA